MTTASIAAALDRFERSARSHEKATIDGELDRHVRAQELASARADLEAELERPVELLLFCPRCGSKHVDEPDDRSPDWTNPPHRSHLCHDCGTIWRPADVATVGVASIETRGKADTWQPDAQAMPADRPPIGVDQVEAWTLTASVAELERVALAIKARVAGVAAELEGASFQ